ncbi:MAG: HAMP domain-containing histidine kinase [Chlorobi bacterium]|nr:HAMP domain-containing histidine kinase [Chlorobiota bacterium]
MFRLWDRPEKKNFRSIQRGTYRWRWLRTLLFIVVAGVIVVGSLVYTQRLVASLVSREQRLVRFYADILQSFASTNSIESLFMLDRVTPMIDFPCIISDSNGVPLEPYDQFTLNIELSRLGRTHVEQAANLRQLAAEMATEYPPIEVRDPNGRVVNYIYYTNSWVVKRLRVLPIVEFILVSLFVAAGYVALALQRRRDESLIWVGMAKETAHQLGTPISSLLGWIEVLQERLDNSQHDDYSTTAIAELRRDVERLRGIAERFSAIGSTPKLEPTNICDIVERTVTYMHKRLPRHGKTIEIRWHSDSERIVVSANEELLSWVLENLIKNAAEAIDGERGVIDIAVSVVRYRYRSTAVRITVSDTGKGMSTAVRRNAFTAGFTTKERGWGLGLALSKRIIEEHHRGKLAIVESAPNQGTTIAIEIPLQDSHSVTS